MSHIQILLQQLTDTETRWEFMNASFLTTQIIAYYAKNNTNWIHREAITHHKRRLRELNILAKETYIRSRSETFITDEQLEAMATPFLGKDIETICQQAYALFCIDYQSVTVIANETQPVMLNVMAVNITRNNGDMSANVDGWEWREDRTYQTQLLFWLHMRNIVFERLKTGNTINTEMIVNLLAERNMFPSDSCRDKFRQWVTRFFEEDYISALHILVPTFEEVYMARLEALWVDVIALVRAANVGTQRKTLSTEIIMSEWVKRLVGENLSKQIDFVLFDHNGHTLRHRVAHGEVNAWECNPISVLSVLSLYLFLAASTT